MERRRTTKASAWAMAAVGTAAVLGLLFVGVAGAGAMYVGSGPQAPPPCWAEVAHCDPHPCGLVAGGSGLQLAVDCPRPP
jgi:hypothetical protein